MDRLKSTGLPALALLLCAAAPLACAADAPTLPAPFETFGGTAWTVADFDGDGRPDVLTARPQFAAEGFRHQISIQLSSRAGRTVSFGVDGVQSGFAGIQVYARDVDGDHDVDLVFTTAVSHQGIGVWINDGAGTFARGNPAVFGAEFRTITSSKAVVQPDPAHLLAFLPRPSSSRAVPVCSRGHVLPQPASQSVCSVASGYCAALTAGALRTRAPPSVAG